MESVSDDAVGEVQKVEVNKQRHRITTCTALFNMMKSQTTDMILLLDYEINNNTKHTA